MKTGRSPVQRHGLWMTFAACFVVLLGFLLPSMADSFIFPHHSSCLSFQRQQCSLAVIDDSSQRKATKDTPGLMTDPNDYRYSASDWFQNIKSLPRSSILREIRRPVLSVTVWGALVSIIHKFLLRTGHSRIAENMCISSTPHSFLVSSLGLLLVFRTNSAYQKFAEGRRIWERILSVSRNLSRMVSLYEDDVGSERKRRVFRLLAAFPYILHHHLEPQCIEPSDTQSLQQTNSALLLHDPSSDGIASGQRRDHLVTPTSSRLKQLLSQQSSRRGAGACWVDRRSLPWCLLPSSSLKKCAASANRPLWICDRLSQELTNVEYSPNFTSRERLDFLKTVDKLSQSIGECERIHQTAVPLNYARHSLRSLTIWLFSLPFCLVQNLGLLTGPVVGAMAWVLFGIYQIGFTIEDPFQGSLRLNSLCDAVYKDIMLSEKNDMHGRDTAFDLQQKEVEDWDEFEPDEFEEIAANSTAQRESLDFSATPGP